MNILSDANNPSRIHLSSFSFFRKEKLIFYYCKRWGNTSEKRPTLSEIQSHQYIHAMSYSCYSSWYCVGWSHKRLRRPLRNWFKDDQRLVNKKSSWHKLPQTHRSQECWSKHKNFPASVLFQSEGVPPPHSRDPTDLPDRQNVTLEMHELQYTTNRDKTSWILTYITRLFLILMRTGSLVQYILDNPGVISSQVKISWVTLPLP